MTTTTTMSPTGPGRADGIDETSERWVTAVHEAAHAVIAEHFGARVRYCRLTSDETGITGHDATGKQHAVVAVAGERATRQLCGAGGGSHTDYEQATTALNATGHDLGWAEHHADELIGVYRRDIRSDAARLYRKGHR